jgi:hypothetical protein
VFGDIRPYVCTFENCTRPDYLFGSRHEWFEHERQIHRREWFCHACQIPFSLQTEFQQHLLLNHSELFSSSELQIVVDRAERAIELPQTCHLCSEQHLSDSLQRHLGRHLQQIALFILPGSIHEDTGSDSDRISDGFQHFEAYDIQHISNKFPDAQEYLVRRFGQANTRRRQRVKTLERHTKLRKDDIDAIIGVEGLMAGTFEDPPGSKEGSGGTALVLSDDLPPVSSSPGGVGSQASSESSDTNHSHHVVLPPLSVHDAFTGTPFQCPFCALVVTFSRRGSWEYVCLNHGNSPIKR